MGVSTESVLRNTLHPSLRLLHRDLEGLFSEVKVRVRGSCRVVLLTDQGSDR